MQTRIHPRSIVFGLFMLSLASYIPMTTFAAQDHHADCVVNVSVEPLSQSMPSNAEGLALVGMRLTIAPGGGFEPHTHPGIVNVHVDSGTLSFTLLEEDAMSINHAAIDGTPAPSDQVTLNQAIDVRAGDWFVETGSIHEAWNHTDEPTVVMLSALVDPALPFVQCADAS